MQLRSRFLLKHMRPPFLNARQRVTPVTLPTMDGSHADVDLTQEPTHANESALFVMKTSRVVTNVARSG